MSIESAAAVTTPGNPYPPATGWTDRHVSVAISPSNSPTSIGLSSLLSTKSQDVAFSLEDGGTVTAHRLILEAQAPTLHTLSSQSTGLNDPFPIPFKTVEFTTMMNLTYGLNPSPNLKLDELVVLLKVSNYCGAIVSKVYAEGALSNKVDTSNCATLADLACTHVCPLLLERCGCVFVSQSEEILKSEGWKTVQNNLELKGFLFDVEHNLVGHSVVALRSKIMKSGGALGDLDGSIETLAKNLERLASDPNDANESKKKISPPPQD
jgi:hypothetical protein